MKYLSYSKYFFDLTWLGVGKLSSKYPSIARAVEAAWYFFIAWFLLDYLPVVIRGETLFDFMGVWNQFKEFFIIPVLMAIGRYIRENNNDE